MNTYAYVENNPLIFIDRDGLAGSYYWTPTEIQAFSDPVSRKELTDFLLEVSEGFIPFSELPDVIKSGDPIAAAFLVTELPGLKNVKAITRACKVTSKAKSPIWKSLKPWRGKTKTNGLTGKDKRLYEYDNTHNEVEVYNARGEHLGAMDAATGEMIKPAVSGRRINVR